MVRVIVWALAQSREDGHRSLVTPERVLSEYNEDLIFFFLNLAFCDLFHIDIFLNTNTRHEEFTLLALSLPL